MAALDASAPSQQTGAARLNPQARQLTVVKVAKPNQDMRFDVTRDRRAKLSRP